jgi:hypothetical protein
MSLFKSFSGLVVVTAGIALPVVASAQGGPLGDEGRTWFLLSGSAASWSTTTRDDGFFTDNPGSSIALEDELNVKRRQAAAGLAFGRRLGENWRIELDWTGTRRSGDAVLKRDIRVAGFVYTSGSQLRSTVNVSGLRINGGWSFARHDGLELGVSYGAKWLTLNQSFERTVPAGASPTLLLSSSNSHTALLPVVGLYGTWAALPALQLSGRAELGLWGAGYGDFSLAAHWRATPNLGVGLGLRHTQGKVGEKWGLLSDGAPWVLDYKSTGPQLLLNVSF